MGHGLLTQLWPHRIMITRTKRDLMKLSIVFQRHTNLLCVYLKLCLWLALSVLQLGDYNYKTLN